MTRDRGFAVDLLERKTLQSRWELLLLLLLTTMLMVMTTKTTLVQVPSPEPAQRQLGGAPPKIRCNLTVSKTRKLLFAACRQANDYVKQRNFASDLKKYLWHFNSGGHINPRALVAAQQKVANRWKSWRSEKHWALTNLSRSIYCLTPPYILQMLFCQNILFRSGCTFVREAVSKVRLRKL